MASVWRQPHSRFYTAIYRDETGQWRRCSTKCEFERAARRIAQAHEERSRAVRLLGAQEAAFLEEVERQRRRLFGDRPQRSAREFSQDWLRTQTGEKAEATAARYQGTVRRFLEFFGD